MTEWYPWNVKPVHVGWYDYCGFLLGKGEHQRVYWNGSIWQIHDGTDWWHLAEDERDEWRGQAHP